MPKMVIITVAVGAGAVAAIDHIQTKNLNLLFEGILREQLSRQATEDRIRFDNYVETYQEAARLISSRKMFHDHLNDPKIFNGSPGSVVFYRDVPDWLPGAGLLRHLVCIQSAIVLDGKKRVREVYHDGPGRPPDTLLPPSARLLASSADQSAMVTIEGRPYVLTSRTIEGPGGRPLATLMIASELNEDFLTATQGGASEERLVAVMAGDSPRIVASTRPDILPPGARLEELQKDFLVTGKSFFDSGASELVMQFASFVPRSQFRDLHGAIISAEKKQRIAMAALLITIFLGVVFHITRSVQKLTERVVTISRDELGLERRTVPRGDQLHVLMSIFNQFTSEVVEARERLRAQAEQALRASEAKYQLLHESMRDAFASVDMSGNIIDFNNAYQEMLGYSGEELKKLTYIDLTPEKWHEFEARIVREEILPMGHSDVYEKEYVRKDGTVFPVELRTFLLKDDSGNNTGMWAIVRDITERKAFLKRLEESELKFRAIFDHAHDGILVADAETSLFFMVNAKACDMLGYGHEELMRLGVKDIHPVDALPIIGQKFGEIVGGRTTMTENIPVLRKDGSIFYADISAAPVTFQERLYAIGVFRNITDRKLAEDELRQAEQRYRSILRTAMDGFWRTDSMGRVLEVNDAYCRMSGYSREELLQMSIPDLEAVEKPEETANHIKNIIEHGYDRFESRHRRKDGTIFDIEVSTQYSHEQGGMFIAFIQDITERKRALDAIRVSLREKDILLREVHHRVKNNLQIISSLLSLQADKISDPESRVLFKDSRDRVKSIALVHEKLYRTADVAHVDLRDYVQSLTMYLFHSYGAPSRGISPHIDIGDVSLGIDLAEPCGLIINELVSNSLKYAFLDDGGTISVTVTQEKKDIVRLVVADSGRGLPPGFDIRTVETLGLRLVRSLVGQIRGSLTVSGGPGTAFVILMPLDHGSGEGRADG